MRGGLILRKKWTAGHIFWKNWSPFCWTKISMTVVSQVSKISMLHKTFIKDIWSSRQNYVNTTAMHQQLSQASQCSHVLFQLSHWCSGIVRKTTIDTVQFLGWIWWGTQSHTKVCICCTSTTEHDSCPLVHVICWLGDVYLYSCCPESQYSHSQCTLSTIFVSHGWAPPTSPLLKRQETGKGGHVVT